MVSWLEVVLNRRRHDQRIAEDCSRQLCVSRVGPVGLRLPYYRIACAYPHVHTVISSIVLIIYCEKLSLLESIQVNYFRQSLGNENLTSKKKQIMVVL